MRLEDRTRAQVGQDQGLGLAVRQLALYATAVGSSGFLAAGLAAASGTSGLGPWDRVLVEFCKRTPPTLGEGSAGGLWSRLAAMLARRWAQPEAARVNRELCRHAGAALAACLRELAADGPRLPRSEDREALQRLAQAAPRAWARLLVGVPAASAAELQTAILGYLQAPAVSPLDAVGWTLVLEHMVRRAGVELSEPAVRAAAQQLEARGHDFVLEVLKTDAAGGGQRLAAGLFASLGELLPGDVAVVEHLEAMADDELFAHRAVLERLCGLDERLRPKLDAMLQRLVPELPLDERQAGRALAGRSEPELSKLPAGLDAGLDEWLDATHSVAFRLVADRTGHDAVHLADELCEAARGDGWHAGWLARAELDTFLQDHARAWRWRQPTLAVVGEAGSRSDQLERWFERIDTQVNAGHRPPRLRLLLLARDAGDARLAALVHRPWTVQGAVDDDLADAERARRLGQLAIDLGQQGRREDALAATQEQVQLYGRLCTHHAGTFEPDHARALTNLGNALSDLGRRDEALAATQAAVDLYTRLAKARPDVFERDLASAFHNLSVDLAHFGRRDEALLAAQQAVELRRRLWQQHPEAFQADLASALTTLGTRFASLGRRQEAVLATQEAVALRRGLARARPEAFEADLARALNNLGQELSDVGRREEALAATEEAVQIRRRLARARPEDFEPDLAVALHNLGLRLQHLGRRDEARQAAEETVALRRRLAQAHPEAFEPALANSLWTRGRIEADADPAAACTCLAEGLRVILPHVRRLRGTYYSIAEGLLVELDAIGDRAGGVDQVLLAEARALLRP